MIVSCGCMFTYNTVRRLLAAGMECACNCSRYMESGRTVLLGYVVRVAFLILDVAQLPMSNLGRGVACEL